ncbi:hypothetical protein MPPM_4724 [Methylorubrum populi]|uniref:Uncharacterized protein n=1 Tax=Methylorubrum populi TaxID=223967 RepID=A0A160PIP0_9HYPH|nr:hypothetical protein [Methylorubrum populi]BAU93329.1 hypothetical protein MPPM_4724 [Methylorubrum populi]
MGFNTVAVLLNDYAADFEREGRIGRSMADAIRQYDHPNPFHRNFLGGTVVSQAHADWSQVVIVSRNSGVRADEANDLDFVALNQMRQCLERHGYSVTKPRKRRPSPSLLAAEGKSEGER